MKAERVVAAEDSDGGRALREYMSEAQQRELDSVMHAEIDRSGLGAVAVRVAVRALGRLPKERRKSKDEEQRKERTLVRRLRNLRGYMSEALQGELDSLLEEVLVAVRALGHLPKHSKNQKDEDQRKEKALAVRLRRLDEFMSEAQQRELDSVMHAEIEEFLVAVRALGHLPKQVNNPQDEDQRKESALAIRLRRLRENMSEAQQGEPDSPQRCFSAC